jgi:hypothetical protein
MIASTIYAITQEESRYTLSGAKVEIDESSMRMITTDGHRLAKSENKEITSKTTIDVLIPRKALAELAGSLRHEGKPYKIAPHQFRHTIATDMIEQGVDVWLVKEYLGHASLKMTQKYIKVYLSTLKRAYDEYRAKKQESAASRLISDHITPTAPPDAAEGADSGWVEGRVGQLYTSPLPAGDGVCVHLPMLDPCPDDLRPCYQCSKFKAFKRHLPYWENKAAHLEITIELLKEKPIYARALQRHERDLKEVKKIRDTIREVGFYDGRIHNK